MALGIDTGRWKSVEDARPPTDPHGVNTSLWLFDAGIYPTISEVFPGSYIAYGENEWIDDEAFLNEHSNPVHVTHFCERRKGETQPPPGPY